MVDELRELFARPIARAIFVAAACGSAVLRLADDTIHGFVITPLAYPTGLNDQSFSLFSVIGDYSSVPAAVAGREVDWLDPMSSAVVLVLVTAATAFVLRRMR